MKRIIVIGTTESVINLNKIGVPVRGKTRAILNIETNEQEQELNGIVRAGLLRIVEDVSAPIVVTPQAQETKDEQTKEPCMTEESPAPIVVKNKGGRPKGSTNSKKPAIKNPLAAEENRRVSRAEQKTQKMGSRVVIGGADGAKEGRMTSSAIDDITEAENTKASIAALKKLEQEEREDAAFATPILDDSNMDASEQMGRKAIISTGDATHQVTMLNSVVPEANVAKNRNPFIDNPLNEDDGDDEGEGEKDLFIEI